MVGYSGEAFVLKGARKPPLQGAQLAGEQLRGR